MTTDSVKLYQGDCLEIMPMIPDGSVDAIICDPPYGTTACKWDSVIPFTWHIKIGKKILYLADALIEGYSFNYFEENKKSGMWEQLNRIIKPNGAICLFGSEPFSSALRMSNIKNYKYDWYFLKDRETGFLNCKIWNLYRKMETISVFYKEQCLYYPILRNKPEENQRPQRKVGKSFGTYREFKHNVERSIPIDKSYPNNILSFSREKGVSLHNTQKPVELMKYLINTYTLEGETVLDFTMGSGTTGVGCVELDRKFIGIETEYFDISQKRIKEAQDNYQGKLFT